MSKNSYVLITPARNEEAYIEKTIQSVINQTFLPQKWVIVSDGSTDRTDEIVKQYTAKYDFIKFLHLDNDSNRNFGSKVDSFKAGYDQLKYIEYGFLGNLDADISLEHSYYEKVLSKFHKNIKLGMAGGIIFEKYDKKYVRLLSSPWSVSGAFQLFRRRCYEDIGGYLSLKKGGIDAIAEVMARMQGWEVHSFPEIRALHHRRINTAGRSIWKARYHDGMIDYSIGNIPLFEITKCLYRMFEHPYVLGSLFRLWGYSSSWLKRDGRMIPVDVVRYSRVE